MQLDFDQLSSSDEDLSKKKQREKRIRQDMAGHRSASRVMNTFEHRYNAQMKMLQEQNRLLKDQQRMIEELKYQQDQQVLQNQLTNLENLKGQQVKSIRKIRENQNRKRKRFFFVSSDRIRRKTTKTIDQRSSSCNIVDSSASTWRIAETNDDKSCRVKSDEKNQNEIRNFSNFSVKR